MCQRILLSILGILFAIGGHTVIAASLDRPDSSPIAGLIFKATLPDSREITFVPTRHDQPLSEFTKAFQEEVCGAKAFVGERIYMDRVNVHVIGDELALYKGEDGTFDFSRFKALYDRDVIHAFEISYKDEQGEPEQAYSVAIKGSDEIELHVRELLVGNSASKYLDMVNLSSVLRYAGVEKLKTLDGALSDTPIWDLSHNPELATKLEDAFADLYTRIEHFGLHRHAEHFRNIYTMSPAVVGGIYYLKLSQEAQYMQSTGIDKAISTMYKDAGKPVLGVESIEDILPLINYHVTFDQVSNDFVSSDLDYKCSPKLQSMHALHQKKHNNKKEIMNVDVLGKRNQA